MIYLDDIINAYFRARKNKRKSPDQVKFEMHWEKNCVQIYDNIINRTLNPTAYTFICDKPRPREVFASDMSTRILHHYLDIRLRPIFEKRLSPHTFNNRVGKGQEACQNAVIQDIYKLSCGFTKHCFITKLDIEGCFPNIVQNIAYKQIEDIIISDYYGYDKSELLYILKVCIFSNPTLHCYRKSPLSKWNLIDPNKSLFNKPLGIGAAIGHLIWQNAVNYYFHEIDEWFEQMNIVYERYVDDFYIITIDKNILTLIPIIREKLKQIGAKLHPHKFYHQHFTKGVECLGSHIKINRVYCNNRILRNAKNKIHQLNRHPVENKVQTIISSINSYLGLLKKRTGFKKAKELIDHVSVFWYKYITYDSDTITMRTKPEYSERHILIRRFKIKISKKWNKRKYKR